MLGLVEHVPRPRPPPLVAPPRSLRTRVLGAVLLSSTLTAGATFAIANGTLHARERAIERDMAEARVARAATIVADAVEEVRVAAKDYGRWAPTAAYLQGDPAPYIGLHLTDETFELEQVDVVVLLDRRGNRVYGAVAPDGAARDDAARDAAAALLLENGLPSPLAYPEGVLWRDGTAWIYASSPAFDPLTMAPLTGYVVFARALDAKRVARMVTRTGVDFTLTAAPSDSPTAARSAIVLDGVPFGHVAVEPRPAGDDLLSAVVLLGSLGAATAVSIGVLWVVLNRGMLRRIASFSDLAHRIRQRRAPAGARLPVSSDDELDELAAAINALLDRGDADAERLRHEALHDPLTGAANRTLLNDRVDLALARALRRREAPRIALLLVDVDRLKAINDRLGHAAGDVAIVSTAEKLRKSFRATDTIARLGGDEFAVLLDDVDPPAALDRVRGLLARLQEPVPFGAGQLDITASVGVAFPRSDGDRDRLLRDADTAMYHAKGAGRNTFVVYDPAQHADMSDRLSIEEDLREAIAREELDVWYQPIVDATTERIVGVEALTRWTHPGRGAVPTDTLIATAEQSRLIEEIDRYVLHRACAAAVRLRALAPGLSMSVNQSARRFDAEDFVADVGAALRASGLPPSSLCIELTESLFSRNERRWNADMAALGALGVQFALDDFGLGYSSLSRLERLPIQIVKIDRSFVAGLLTDQGATCRAVIRFAAELGRAIVAEGVERPEQAAQLRGLGCTRLQGFHYGRPAPEAALMERLRAR